MSDKLLPLFVLLVDDEADVLEQLMATLPTELEGYQLVWDKCGSFEEALSRLESRRYDIVVTDLAFKSSKEEEPDFRGLKTINEIRGRRFCPVVAYSSRSKPDELTEDVFVRFADKARGNDDIIAKLTEVLQSGVPAIARRLHDELDGIGGQYLWDFLAKRWVDLKKTGIVEGKILERLIRRRAATQLARLEKGLEIAEIAPAEFYLFPKISGGEYRLGEIVKSRTSDDYRVILTPHCHLAIQKGHEVPRADFVLTLRTIKAGEQISPTFKDKKWDLVKKTKEMRRLIDYPPDFGTPSGRYWFLPRFLEMPDLYCDFMRVESVAFDTLEKDFEAFAVLDTPFAEALQSRFAQFYSSVGTANLRAEDFFHLIPENETLASAKTADVPSVEDAQN